MITNFNEGKPFHGSETIEKGKLTGATDTDYFYFFCPSCDNSQIMQVLDYKVVQDGPVEYAKEHRPSAKRDFIIALQLWCRQCGTTDFVKISNTGWQGGRLSQSPIFWCEEVPFTEHR